MLAESVTPQNAMYDNIRGPIVEIHDEFSRALASVRSLVDHFKEGVLAPIAEVNTEDTRGYFEGIIDVRRCISPRLLHIIVAHFDCA